MSRRMIVCAAVAVALAHCACAELLTFTNAVKNSGGQYQWDNKLNWLTADGANKAPAEGDDLLCATKITTFHAVATGNYFKSVRMKYGFDYSGFSWRAPCLKEGGDGLVLEGGVGVYMEDIDGREMLLSHVGPGQTFGEALCYLRAEAPLIVTALTDARVLWMRCDTLREAAQSPLQRLLQERFTAMLREQQEALDRLTL